MNSLNTQVSFVFFAVDDVQQSGNLVVLEVQSHIIHSSDCETEENEVRNKNLWVLSQFVMSVFADTQHLCLSDTASWWWIPWFGVEGDTWVWGGLYSPPPACWFGVSSPWSGFLHSTAETVEAEAQLIHKKHQSEGFGCPLFSSPI